jgi:hypothetical protein
VATLLKGSTLGVGSNKDLYYWAKRVRQIKATERLHIVNFETKVDDPGTSKASDRLRIVPENVNLVCKVDALGT